MLRPSLSGVSWEEARKIRNHGSWNWKDPLGLESPAVFCHGQTNPPGIPCSIFFFFCKICFQMTQAGSLPALSGEEEQPFLRRKYFPQDWLGCFVSWLQPHHSWLVSLRPPQTSPLPLRFPHLNPCHASAKS